jgi:F0F1-type ATP synthase membrane subunit b/b'
MAKLQDRARDRASDVKPYIERALKDERVREDVKSAIATAREIYEQLMGGRAMTSVAAKVATDKEIQQSLRDAIDDLRDAAERVQGKDSHSGRNATLLITGIALGILFNPVTGPGTRRWLQDKIFGEGEEFEYRQDNAK